MENLQISEPFRKAPPLAPFALGFRPFFLLAGICAVLLMALWLGIFAHALSVPAYYSAAVQWHAHEMVFGYAAAVIAGFLLTAVGNWTGQRMIHGVPLAALALLWLTARMLPFIHDVPGWLVASVDMAFLPVVAVLIMVPILRVRNYRNLIFVAMLLAMAWANAMDHYAILSKASTSVLQYHTGVQIGLYMVLMIIIVMGGRVIPFFIARGAEVITRKWHYIEMLSIGGFIALIVVSWWSSAVITGAGLVMIAAIHGVRLSGWWRMAAFRVPLCWVLMVAYAWLVVGMAMLGFELIFGMGIGRLALHALTAGGIGGMTLGMMARVALGHTSRPLEAHPLINIAFILLNTAVLVRVFMPMVMTGFYSKLIMISGVLWISAFAIFLIIYTPILLRARIDGRPG